MKQSLLASAIALTAIATPNANASLSVTNMIFEGSTYAASGTIGDDDTLGFLASIDDFSSFPWTATQETMIISNSNGVTWAGTNTTGTWDYAADIANMTEDQVAVGLLWDWNTVNDVAILAVFDCTSGTTCIGQTTGADGNAFDGTQTGAIVGFVFAFEGNGTLTAASTVPVPAAAWLMGSGLIGLIGLARRKS